MNRPLYRRLLLLLWVLPAAGSASTATGVFFLAPMDVLVPAPPTAVAAGDFNGDQRPDAVITFQDRNEIMLLLSGGSTYTANVGADSVAVVVGNFDGDTNLDVAVANSDANTVAVLAGLGDGTLGAAVHYPVGAFPVSIAVGRFNADNNVDLAVANLNSNSVSLLLGTGGGGFLAAETIATGGTRPSSVAAADLNGDGSLDLAISHYSSNDVAVLLGTGAGSFQPPLLSGPTPDGASTIATGFLNADAMLDVIVASSASAFSVFLGDGGGALVLAGSYNTSGQTTSLVVADFNGDGKSDLATSIAGPDEVSVFRGNGDGTFADHVDSVGVGRAPSDLAAADFDNDGRLDVVTSNLGAYSASFRFGRGDGTFRQSPRYPTTGHPQIAGGPTATADFNADGRMDIATTSWWGYLVVLLGRGDGTFAYGPNVVPLSEYATSMATGDFDGNGATDVVITARIPECELWLFLGNGDGTFQPQLLRNIGGGAGFVSVSDFNGDGVEDLAVANEVDISLLRGRGDGTFEPTMHLAVPGGPSALAAGDLNGDTVADLAVTARLPNALLVLLGNGDGTFRPPSSFGTDQQPYFVMMGDLNADSNRDIAVASAGGLYVFMGNGDGSLQRVMRHFTGLIPRSLAVADFDADGIPDMAAANNYSNNVSILRGRGDGTFALQGTAFGTDRMPMFVVAGDFNGDTKPDLTVTHATTPGLLILLNSTP